MLSEPLLAQVARGQVAFPDGAIRINANENPLGPCKAAREAVIAITPEGGRYHFNLTEELVRTFAGQQDLKPEYIMPFPGSTPGLYYTVAAFTSPKAAFVTAEPGYEAGAGAAKAVGARVVSVPLTKAWSHDVKAMLAAAPDAGLFYICTPNNPTGTLTSREDIEYLVEHKPAGSRCAGGRSLHPFLRRAFVYRHGQSGQRVSWSCAPFPSSTAWRDCAADLPSPVPTC